VVVARGQGASSCADIGIVERLIGESCDVLVTGHGKRLGAVLDGHRPYMLPVEVASPPSAANDGFMPRRFHVHFVWPNGWTYELWPTAEDEVGAVLKADALLEYRERIGIRDFLEPDGVSVRSPASLSIRAAEEVSGNDGLLRVTSPDGVVSER
jgi:hypothetical protein